MERLVYSSVARADLSTEDVFEIIKTSQRNNAAREVTGFLMEDEGRFLQLLEGPVGEVEGLYEKIARDLRHDAITELFREPATDRLFPDWQMKQLISFSSVPAMEELQNILRDQPDGAGLLALVREFLRR